jgi:pimeloyl-ACP methyl ester carboxylesterase
MARRLPRGQLEVIPNAGHTIHLEQPAAFQSRAIDFLAQQE